MKKVNYFIIFISILIIVIFGLSNYFLKKKNNITYKILFHEPCILSQTVEEMIYTFGENQKLFHKHWRKQGEHCEMFFRQSNYVFAFKNQTKKDQFISEINSDKFKEKLTKKLYKKKIRYINTINIISNYVSKMEKASDSTNDAVAKFMVTLKIEKKKLEKELIEINQVSELLENNYPIIEIKQISKIKSIKNFNLKLSIFITSNLIIFVLIVVYIFRKKQLGFYR